MLRLRPRFLAIGADLGDGLDGHGFALALILVRVVVLVGVDVLAQLGAQLGQLVPAHVLAVFVDRADGGGLERPGGGFLGGFDRRLEPARFFVFLDRVGDVFGQVFRFAAADLVDDVFSRGRGLDDDVLDGFRHSGRHPDCISLQSVTSDKLLTQWHPERVSDRDMRPEGPQVDHAPPG